MVSTFSCLLILYVCKHLHLVDAASHVAPRYVIASAAFLVVCSLLKKGEKIRRRHHFWIHIFKEQKQS
jgi:hypothetical protein